MENSQVQLWQYHAPVLSCFQTKEEDPLESHEFSEDENKGYSIKDIQTPQYRDDGQSIEEVLSSKGQAHISKMKDDYTGDCISVKPKSSINSPSHRQRKLPRLKRIKQPQDSDDGHFINEVLIPESQPHSMDMGTMLKSKTRPFLPPLKRIISLPPFIPLQQYTLASEVRGFTQVGNLLTTFTESRKEIHFFDKNNSNDSSFIKQQKLQEPQMINKKDKSNQLSLELINSNSVSNLSPNNLKRNSSRNMHSNSTKLQPSRSQGKYFRCSGCNSIEEEVNQVKVKQHIKNAIIPLNYCLKCTYSNYKMVELIKKLNKEKNVIADQPRTTDKSVASIKMSPGGHSVDGSIFTDVNLNIENNVISDHPQSSDTSIASIKMSPGCRSVDSSISSDVNIIDCNQDFSREKSDELSEPILKKSISMIEKDSPVVPGNGSISTDVSLIDCNQDFSREKYDESSVPILKKSISMIEKDSPVIPGNVVYIKEKIQKENLRTDFGYKSNLDMQKRGREEHRCKECGYITRYSHMIKEHIRCHINGKLEKKRIQSPSKRRENRHIYSMNRFDENENEKSSTQMPPKKDKICKNKNKRTVKKTQSVKPKTKEKEICALCKYEANSLPELNLHLRTHIPCENQRVNNVESYTPVSNSEIEKNKITVESSACLTENEKMPEKISYIERDNDKPEKSEFLTSLNLRNLRKRTESLKAPKKRSILQRNSKKCTESIKAPTKSDNSLRNSRKRTASIKSEKKSSILIGKDNNNKINCKEDQIVEDTVNIDNKHPDGELISNKCIIINSDSEAADDVCNDDYDDYDEQDQFQPITDTFNDHDDNLRKKNLKKSLLINEKTECSHITETAESLNLDNYDENELPDLVLEDDVEMDNDSVSNPLLEKKSAILKFKSEKNINEISKFDKMVNNMEDKTCSECSACFKNTWNNHRHIKISHKGCQECGQGKICAYRSSNKHPEIIQFNPEPFECFECPYVSTSKGNFLRHMWSHSIEKQFECKVCGYRCTGSGQLQRHMWVHKAGGKHLNFWPLADMYDY